MLAALAGNDSSSNNNADAGAATEMTMASDAAAADQPMMLMMVAHRPPSSTTLMIDLSPPPELVNASDGHSESMLRHMDGLVLQEDKNAVAVHCERLPTNKSLAVEDIDLPLDLSRR